MPILVSQVSVSGNAGYKKEFFLELSNNETSSFKRSSSSRDEEPVTSCTSLPAMPYASLPSLREALLNKQVCFKYLVHGCITYIYIIYVGPWTNKAIQIRNIFSLLILILSQTFPSQVLSAAVKLTLPPSLLGTFLGMCHHKQ